MSDFENICNKMAPRVCSVLLVPEYQQAADAVAVFENLALFAIECIFNNLPQKEDGNHSQMNWSGS